MGEPRFPGTHLGGAREEARQTRDRPENRELMFHMHRLELDLLGAEWSHFWSFRNSVVERAMTVG